MLSPPSAIQSILSRAGGCPEVLPTGAMVIQGYFLPVTLAMLWISGRPGYKFPYCTGFFGYPIFYGRPVDTALALLHRLCEPHDLFQRNPLLTTCSKRVPNFSSTFCFLKWQVICNMRFRVVAIPRRQHILGEMPYCTLGHADLKRDVM